VIAGSIVVKPQALTLMHAYIMSILLPPPSDPL
jgi:hypothetical protein